jgi:hypothetical protein
MATYCSQVDDIRAALKWCFGESGDLELGIQLTAFATLPMTELGLLEEQSERIERALAHIHELVPAQPALELRLNAALSLSSSEPGWRGRPQLTIFARTVELAQGLEDPTYRIVALYSTWLGAFVTGDYLSATRAAERAHKTAQASGDEAGLLLSERLLAQCRHFTGDQQGSRALAERVLGQDAYRMPPGYASMVPRRISMRILLARISWLEGFPDRALRLAEEGVSLAEGAHPHALMQSLGMAAIPIAFWRGEHERARELTERLAMVAHKRISQYWASWARSFASALAADEGATDGQAGGLARMPIVQTINAKELDCIASVARCWSHSVSLQRVSSGAAGWCAAEILRKQGEHILGQGDQDAVAAAEHEFRRSMDIARRQGAVSWELRTATSQARLWIRQGRFSEARELVAPLYFRFQEGLDTADLRAAREIVSS